ncbi:hypothetical protein AB0M28_24360 [Streptomyces sp. NPDC051940]|uniref:hypothetical protein n=1 Tax=Streptomyces sp. NPDC051940 TaxID=3155675 RepID=UPI00344AA8AF
MATTRPHSDIAPLQPIPALFRWIGPGRKPTQTGRIALTDARILIAHLDTGDKMDERIGDRMFRTKSSEELPRLNLLVEWFKAARLLRVTQAAWCR